MKVKGRAYVRVGLTVTVMDRSGRPVQGLAREDFQLFEDGAEVTLQDFWIEGERIDRPLSVAVLLDLSESMSEQVQRVREAAEALLGALRPIDEIMVAKFNQDRVVLQPFTHDPGDPERTLSKIGKAEGGTALFRSIALTLRDLRPRPGRKVILVVTDGGDNDIARDTEALQSIYLQDLLRLCLRTETVVYGIRPGMVNGRPPFERFVEETGGRLLYTGGDLERLFKQLGEELLSQYHLGYDIDPEVKQGKRRSIRVQLSRSDLTVKTMSGFFTPRSQLETLLRDIKDEDARLRADAAYALGFVSEPRSSKALRKALHDKDEKVRELAAGALARLGEEEAIPDLKKVLGDRKEMAAVRGAALRSLAVLSGEQARPFLEEYLLGETDPGLKEVARALLSSL
ncbi:MAG TPA: VWA domain-containing protein [Candidatus Polarisedimenticolia bacterium]|nr:VWA domain-containing protein [Candidatus Polarisedimenticolia bacterium]